VNPQAGSETVAAPTSTAPSESPDTKTAPPVNSPGPTPSRSKADETTDRETHRPAAKPTRTHKATPRPKPKKTRAAAPSTDPRFPTCAAAKRAGYGPYHRGINREYAWYIDRDGDGTVCE
ncbi:MAG: excalibur calcium-binding domain-containing protein, partial [Actinomadura rubrobrunea]|nr:excalibur calcium-binding domain-containing protein [Actinomadura rubrobrunea]